MNKRIINLTLILLTLFLNFSCDDINDVSVPVFETFLCCVEYLFDCSNIDYLDFLLGEIYVVGKFFLSGKGIRIPQLVSVQTKTKIIIDFFIQRSGF